MGIISFSANLIKRKPRTRSGYNKLSPTAKRSVKIVRFGAGNKTGSKPLRLWRLRVTPKLRLVRLVSPIKLWRRFKNAYMKMMLRLANISGTDNTGNVFGEKKGRDLPMDCSRSEFENRLVLEIYKSMVSSLELGYKSK